MSDPTDPTDPTHTTTDTTAADAPPRTPSEEYDDALDDARDAAVANRYRALGRFLHVTWETFGAGLLDKISDLMEAIAETDIERRADESLRDSEDDDGSGSPDGEPPDLTHFKRQPDRSVTVGAFRFHPATGTFESLDGGPVPEIPAEVRAVIHLIRSTLAGVPAAQGHTTEPDGAAVEGDSPSDA